MDWHVGAGVAALLYIAFLIKVFGFLARDELRLRLLMLIGTLMTVLYYFIAAERPLWDPVITNSVLALTNTWMIGVVLLERTTWFMPKEAAALFDRFPMLSAGQFRRLFKTGSLSSVDTMLVLTTAGQPVTQLHYVVDGHIEIEKDGHTTVMDGGMFIGELAFLTGDPATATVRLLPGARKLTWSAEDLRKLGKRHPKMNIALQAQFNTDLVRKVARSRPNPLRLEDRV